MGRAIHDMIHAADGLVCRRSADTFIVYCLHREDYEEILERASVIMDGGYQIRVRMGVYSNVDREIDMERRVDRTIPVSINVSRIDLSDASIANALTALPIDALKIDTLFIRTAFGAQKDTRLLSAVFGIARSLGLPTIAEGVETEEQLNALKTMGCDIVQGYYFSKPLPAESFEAFVRGLDSQPGIPD